MVYHLHARNCSVDFQYGVAVENSLLLGVQLQILNTGSISHWVIHSLPIFLDRMNVSTVSTGPPFPAYSSLTLYRTRSTCYKIMKCKKKKNFKQMTLHKKKPIISRA